jgi:hypothetical protein
MSFDLERLYALLPEYRRSADALQNGPLKALLAVVADQVAILEENLAQLRDDQSVETCAPWLLPYVGDLIGIDGLPAVAPKRLNPRAEVANTIGYRRRKGTAAMLEQLARDITGWPARAVEFFELLATTQHMNHVRPGNHAFASVRGSTGRQLVARLLEQLDEEARSDSFVDHALRGTGVSRALLVRAKILRQRPDGLYLRGPGKLRWSDFDLELVEESPWTTSRPFENAKTGGDLTHRPDVRMIASGRGRYNIPNVGLFLWRLFPYRFTNSAPFRVNPGVATDLRYTFHPLGLDAPLFSAGRTEADVTHLAEPIDVPAPMSRRALAASLDEHWGNEQSLVVQKISAAPCDPDPTIAAPKRYDADNVEICDLSTWSHTPVAKEIAIDPVLGRFVLRDPAANGVVVTYRHGFSSDLGGGEYRRIDTFDAVLTGPISVGACAPALNTITAGLAALGASGGAVEITDSRRYAEGVSIPSGDRIELRAAQGRRPTLVLSGDLAVNGTKESEVTINGLLIAGTIVVGAQIRKLRLLHCTLVGGLPSTTMPQVSLRVPFSNVEIEIDHCIMGGLRIDRGSEVRVTDSIIDAGLDTDGRESRVAFSDADAESPGGRLRIENSTVIGKVHTDEMVLASNTIFLARLGDADTWTAPIRSRRRQEGCVRFSYLPAGSVTPRRHRCQPEEEADAERLRPRLRSYRWFDPTYCQLSDGTPAEIRRGADDDSEMGAFHELYQPQREDHLRARLHQFLRFGLEVGIFHVT